jgi:hypothetical protein
MALVLTTVGITSFFLIFASSGPSEGIPGVKKEKSLHMEKVRNPGQFNLDHFKVYQIEAQQASAQVWLRGQFDEDFRTAFLYLYERFLNPVDKNGEGIIDKDAHLNWYAIEAEFEPTREVSLFNQFGLQTIRIGQAVALLAPAEKVEPGSKFPKKLDHYKVYEVLYAQPVSKNVYLKDQFGDEDNFAYVAKYFAVPVEKRHEDKYFPILNKEDHLIFYTLEPIARVESRPTIDQFGDHDMRTRHSELLGVPSAKLAWQ